MVFDCWYLRTVSQSVSRSPASTSAAQLQARPHSVPGSENNLKTIEKFYKTFFHPVTITSHLIRNDLRIVIKSSGLLSAGMTMTKSDLNLEQNQFPFQSLFHTEIPLIVMSGHYIGGYFPNGEIPTSALIRAIIRYLEIIPFIITRAISSRSVLITN